MTEAPSLARQLTIALLGLAATVGWLAAGYVVLIALILTPHPGQEVTLRALQLVLIAGWIATLAWLLRHLMAGRLRFLAAPVVAWAWTLGVGALIRQVAYLNVGY